MLMVERLRLTGELEESILVPMVIVESIVRAHPVQEEEAAAEPAALPMELAAVVLAEEEVALEEVMRHIAPAFLVMLMLEVAAAEVAAALAEGLLAAAKVEREMVGSVPMEPLGLAVPLAAEQKAALVAMEMMAAAALVETVVPWEAEEEKTQYMFLKLQRLL